MKINDLFTSKETREQELSEALSSYSSNTQVTLATLLMGVDQNHKEMIIALIMLRDEPLALELAALYPHCTHQTGPAFNKAHYLIGLVRGLHQYDQYRNIRLDTITGDDLHKASALIHITSLILRYHDNPPINITDPDDPHIANIHLTNSATVNLITQHHHRTDDLIKALSSAQLSGRAFAGLPHLRWYQKQKLHTITDKTIDTALNYIRVTEALQMNADKEHLKKVQNAQGSAATYIDSPELEQLIEQNPHEINDFIDYADERWSADLKVFREYMKNGTALKEGIL